MHVQIPAHETRDVFFLYGAGVDQYTAQNGVQQLLKMIGSDITVINQYEQQLLLKAQKYFAHASLSPTANTPSSSPSTSSPPLDTLLTQSIAISAKLVDQVFLTRHGSMVFPGHMYPRFYARDSHWQMLGLLSIGQFEKVRKLIEIYAKFQDKNGFFPTSINMDGSANYFSLDAPDIDSTAYFVMSVCEYVRWSKDNEWGKGMWDRIVLALRALGTRDTNGDVWLEQGENQDWADTLERKGNVTYCQAVYYRALDLACQLGHVIGKTEDNSDIKEYDRKCRVMREQFDGKFWENSVGFYVDYVTEDGVKQCKLTQDACLAFVYGLATNKQNIQQHLQQLKQRCWTKWGAAKQEAYDNVERHGPEGFYHNG